MNFSTYLFHCTKIYWTVSVGCQTNDMKLKYDLLTVFNPLPKCSVFCPLLNTEIQLSLEFSESHNSTKIVNRYNKISQRFRMCWKSDGSHFSRIVDHFESLVPENSLFQSYRMKLCLNQPKDWSRGRFKLDSLTDHPGLRFSQFSEQGAGTVLLYSAKMDQPNRRKPTQWLRPLQNSISIK